jgi:hypothetical protein
VCVCGQTMLCPVCAPRVAAFRAAEISSCFEHVTAIARAPSAARSAMSKAARARRRAVATGTEADAELAAVAFAEATAAKEAVRQAVEFSESRPVKFHGRWEAHLVTFTLPHERGNVLAEELDSFAAAWRTLMSGRGGVQFRTNVLGHHLAREVTLGKRGWHYHHHLCLYCRPGYDFDFLRRRWLSVLKDCGRYTTNCDEHAFHVAGIQDGRAAQYVSKIAGAVDAASRTAGLELAGAAMKSARGPFVGRNLIALLFDAVFFEDGFALERWCEAVRAITSRKISSVRWSRGLRALVTADPEKTNEQIVAEETTPADVLLGALDAEQWLAVTTLRAEFALCVAANQGREAVNNFLAGLSLGELRDPARIAPYTKG